MMNIKEILLLYTKILSKYSTTPYLDVEILLSYILKKKRIKLYTNQEQILNNKEIFHFKYVFLQRLKGKPIAYITGIKTFWNFDFYVNKFTFIPRNDTETLIEILLKKQIIKKKQKSYILDIGTGSGNISITIASLNTNNFILAIDICNKALSIASENAKINNINNIKFLKSDFYSSLYNCYENSFDLIVSNPPYIGYSDKFLCKNVLKYEPILAFISPFYPLFCIKEIIKNAKFFLKKEGCIILEHGFNQNKEVNSLLKYYKFNMIENHMDINGFIRITSAYN